MKLQDFRYNLPEELIASEPCEERVGSRLLHLDGNSGSISQGHFPDIIDHLEEGDLLVLNNTKVIPARLAATRFSGGRLEVMIERIISNKVAYAHVKASNTPKAGTGLTFDEGSKASITGRKGSLFELELESDAKGWMAIVNEIGKLPLPHYIGRSEENIDKERYQTVYANDEKAGSVAAPTAGLHYNDDLLNAIKNKGVSVVFVTLQVGAGTFQPVRVDDIQEHKMHSERIEVTKEVCDRVSEAKAGGSRVIAVGTTSVRCLETAWNDETKKLEPYEGETDIFIYPGYDFKCVDMLQTNFHLPESSLLMLVSAFAGMDNIKKAYQYAIEEKFRFFSYGDAMLLTKQDKG